MIEQTPVSSLRVQVITTPRPHLLLNSSACEIYHKMKACYLVTRPVFSDTSENNWRMIGPGRKAEDVLKFREKDYKLPVREVIFFVRFPVMYVLLRLCPLVV
jgi:hypothetical protein